MDLGTGNNYKLIFRIPFREYSPVGVAAVKECLKRNKANLASLLLLPEIRSSGITQGNLSRLMHRIKRWHLPNIIANRFMLAESGGVWTINDLVLAKEYVRWQEMLNQRENRSLSFILKHLSSTSRFLSTTPTVKDEISAFSIIDHIVECEVPAAVFVHFRNTYKLDVGDTHLHWRIPKAVFDFPLEAQQEFVRGLADTIGDFDYNPLMKPNWRVQFSILFENHKLAVDICQLLQRWLRIPVFYIDYAGGKRKHRDHLLKVWVNAFDTPCFPEPLFYNERKQIDFLTHLQEAKRAVSAKPPTSLRFCPRTKLGSSERKYIKKCRTYGCPLVKRKRTVPLPKWYGKRLKGTA